MAGTFRTDGTFTIRGHGLFLRGRMTAGTVQVGETIVIPDQQGLTREERVTRVDSGTGADATGRVQGFLGLQLGALVAGDIPLIQALLIPGLELRVAEAR